MFNCPAHTESIPSKHSRTFGSRACLNVQIECRGSMKSKPRMPSPSAEQHLTHCGSRGPGSFPTGKAWHFRTPPPVARAVFLARNSITGPLEVFEGDKGVMDAIAGVFDIDWLREDLDRVKRTISKDSTPKLIRSQPSRACWI